MIDMAREELISLSRAAAMLPGRPSIATLWRWRTKGVRGRLLESVWIGGRVYTSAEAIQRFARPGKGEIASAGTPRQRQRAIEAAEKELGDAGI